MNKEVNKDESVSQSSMEEAPEVEQYKKLIADMFEVFDKIEVSDSEREFRPTTIQSCRVMDGMKLAETFLALRKLAGLPDLPDLPEDPTYEDR